MTLQSFPREQEAAREVSRGGVLLRASGRPFPLLGTESGRLVNRFRKADVTTISGMSKKPSPKATLWANVSALMKAEYGRENLTRLSGDTGIGPGSASRIKAQNTAIGLDVLEKIARKFGIEPWQLLFPVEESEKEFLELCRAWKQADDNRRKMMLIAGRALLGGASTGDSAVAGAKQRGA